MLRLIRLLEYSDTRMHPHKCAEFPSAGLDAEEGKLIINEQSNGSEAS